MASGRPGTLGLAGRAIKGLICIFPRFRALLEQRDQLLLDLTQLRKRVPRAEERDVGLDGGRELQVEVLNLLRHFTPRKVTGFDKARIGRQGDGGYVLLDDFAGVATALSFGIESECSWDMDIAGRGIDVHMFDHTVDGPPADHPRFRFHKKRIAATLDEQSETLGSILTNIPESEHRIVLKIDIEGSEWEVFEQSTIEDLSRICQIVCEFHDFSRIADPAWRDRAIAVMAKLKSVFEVIHVHGNNHTPIFALTNIPFPDVIEVTMVRKDAYGFEDEFESFPTNLDFANNDKRPDIFLGGLRFPNGVPHG